MYKNYPNWPKIKNEYATTGISYRKLCEKNGVSFGTLQDRAAREKWTEHRDKFRQETIQKTIQKMSDKASDEQAEEQVTIDYLRQLAETRARQWLENPDIMPRDLKAVTGALKDLSDIAKSGSDALKPPVINIIGRLANGNTDS